MSDISVRKSPKFMLGRGISGVHALALSGLTACNVFLSQDANACGCLSPPEPNPSAISSSEYAVNQQSESIIFEIEEGYVTAHVLIRYEGDPESFAWIVPVPSVPELKISNPVTFGLIEDATTPFANVTTNNLCPVQEWRCETHPAPYCPEMENEPGDPNYFAAGDGDGDANLAPGSGGASAEAPPPVTVYQRVQVGSYDTVTFGAGDATAAVAWLNDNGFITNATMAPFMQPYIDDNMLFVASKLIPGAGSDEIRPLEMRFAAEMAMIPLQLTAIAAEPHLTVTAYLFGDSVFDPAGFNLIELDQRELGQDREGRSGYPMLLARAIDDAGGHAFVDEYSGSIPPIDTGPDFGCCQEQFVDPNDGIGGQGGQSSSDPILLGDSCGLGGDGLCQCPYAEFDQADCAAAAPDLLEGLELYEELRSKHSVVTRLTTRLSAEEMTKDPGFLPSTRQPRGPLSLQGEMQSLQNCQSDIISVHDYYDLVQASDCSAMYCGEGECVATGAGPGCVCDEGFIARSFRDLDGQDSVTCVPEEAPVDFGADGLPLPDACNNVSCGMGTCVDIGGFPACACNEGLAAALSSSVEDLTCVPILHYTGTPGGTEYTGPMSELEVCAPPPPTCGKFGWLVDAQAVGRHGTICASSVPSTEARTAPPAPTCEDYYPGYYDGNHYVGKKGESGCSCRGAGTDAPRGPWGPLSLASLLAGAAVIWRRRAGRRRHVIRID